MNKCLLCVLVIFSFVVLYGSEEEGNAEIFMAEVATEPTNVSGFYLPKHPTKAALLSTFVPSAGQIYNGKYLKASAVLAVQTYFIGTAIQNDKKMKEYKDKRFNAEGIGDANNQAKYQEYYDKRQSFIFWIGASVLLSAMDAYVDAHLINFKERKNDIHLKFEDQKLQVSIGF